NAIGNDAAAALARMRSAAGTHAVLRSDEPRRALSRYPHRQKLGAAEVAGIPQSRGAGRSSHLRHGGRGSVRIAQLLVLRRAVGGAVAGARFRAILGSAGQDVGLSRVPPASPDDCLATPRGREAVGADRKSTRLNSSHVETSYAVFCLKKKKRVAMETIRKKQTYLKTSHKSRIIYDNNIKIWFN